MNFRFSHSQLTSFQACEKKYLYSRVLNLAPRKQSAALGIGKKFHHFLEQWRKGRKPGDPEWQPFVDEFDFGLATQEEIDKHEIDMARAEVMAECYADIYATDHEAYEMEPEIESEFQIGTLGDDTVSYSGAIDCLAKCRETGDYWIIENKTAGSWSANHVRKIPIDTQVLGYMWLAANHLGGKFPKGVIYYVTMKTSHRRTQKETLAEFCGRLQGIYKDRKGELFIREKVPIGMALLTDWVNEIKPLAARLATKLQEKEKVWTRRSAECVSHFGPCPYLSICTSGEVDESLYEKVEPEREVVTA